MASYELCNRACVLNWMLRPANPQDVVFCSQTVPALIELLKCAYNTYPEDVTINSRPLAF